MGDWQSTFFLFQRKYYTKQTRKNPESWYLHIHFRNNSLYLSLKRGLFERLDYFMGLRLTVGG
jgi:hypothetical protein